MKKKSLRQIDIDKEISILQTIIYLFNNKWKIIIISLITSLIFGVYAHKQPITYEISTSIRPGDSSQFVKYNFLNEILSSSTTLLPNKIAVNPNFVFLNSSSIFEQFFEEFSDYEEIISRLKEDPYVQNKLNNLSEENLEINIANFAKSFVIIKNKNDEKQYVVKVKWHDEKKAIEMIEDIFLAILKNVKIKIIKDINELSNSVEEMNAFKLNALKIKLKSIQEIQKERLKQRIQFLQEQALIAEELGIKKSETTSSVQLNSTLYFLNGFENINNEREIIKKIPNQAFQLNNEYTFTTYQIEEINNDMSAEKFSKGLNVLKNDDFKDWISFNLNLADIASNQKSIKKYSIYGFIFGLIIGSLLLILRNVSRDIK